MSEVSRDVNQHNQRIWFLQLSRAIACLLIVYAHWVSLILQPNVLVGSIHQLPITNYSTPKVYYNLFFMLPTSFYPTFFALALFFLISGYVIPLSLMNSNPFEFLIRRVLRIYPVLITCLIITIFTVKLGRHLDALSNRHIYSFSHYWASFFLVRAFTPQIFIEQAAWTLEVEIHFYLICFILAFFQGYKNPFIVLFCALALLGLEKFAVPDNIYITSTLGLDASCICIMFIGTALFNWHKKYWNIKQTILVILSLFTLNYFALHYNYMFQQLAYFNWINNIYAFLLLISLMLFNKYLPYVALLDKIAQISYPLYLVHGFTGYVFFFIFYKATHSLILTIPLSLSSVFIISILIHQFIEKPGINISRRATHFLKMKKHKSQIVMNNA